MELRTTVRDFTEKIRTCHIPPDIYIRVYIDNYENKKLESIVRKTILPAITPEEQRRLLNLMPDEYSPEDSEELVNIIENSHKNTDIVNFE
jgi:hypothetical protein